MLLRPPSHPLCAVYAGFTGKRTARSISRTAIIIVESPIWRLPFRTLRAMATRSGRINRLGCCGKRSDTLYSEWIQSVPAAEQDAVIAAQATYTNYLTVYETVLQRQYDDEAAALHINSVLDRQCAMLCNVLHGEQ